MALHTATIGSSASQSNELTLSEGTLFALEMSTAWTAADISFMASSTRGGTKLPVLRDDGTEYTISVAASKMVIIDLAGLAICGLQYIKLRSGTSAAVVTQDAERVLKLVVQ